MIIRKLKLKLTNSQESTLNQWLRNLTGVYNWAIRKIELDSKNKIYYSKLSFQNLLANHGSKLNIPSHVIQGTLTQAHGSWARCFKKIAKMSRLKSIRNKLNSIPFPDPIRSPKENRIGLPLLGKLKFHKQSLPSGKIKCGRIIKRPSGWYLCLWIDAVHTFPVKMTDKAVGIDPGFSTLLTLSDGTKIENPRELRKGSERLAQAQRGKRKKLSGRLQEKQSNRRNDRNHKISRNLVENYKTIFYSDDNFKGLQKLLGKSIAEASLGNLIGMLNYKGRLGGREIISISSRNTTMTCVTCWSLTGPTGLDGLAVRHWKCTECGSFHDRDINSAMVVYNVGSGFDLGVQESPCRG
ncbi:transposase [Candidatus Pacearchaeota archaeon]|nr:transposase [Candidatus Pacearchaeota archaeon]